MRAVIQVSLRLLHGSPCSVLLQRLRIYQRHQLERHVEPPAHLAIGPHSVPLNEMPAPAHVGVPLNLVANGELLHKRLPKILSGYDGRGMRQRGADDAVDVALELQRRGRRGIPAPGRGDDFDLRDEHDARRGSRGLLRAARGINADGVAEADHLGTEVDACVVADEDGAVGVGALAELVEGGETVVDAARGHLGGLEADHLEFDVALLRVGVLGVADGKGLPVDAFEELGGELVDGDGGHAEGEEGPHVDGFFLEVLEAEEGVAQWGEDECVAAVVVGGLGGGLGDRGENQAETPCLLLVPNHLPNPEHVREACRARWDLALREGLGNGRYRRHGLSHGHGWIILAKC